MWGYGPFLEDGHPSSRITGSSTEMYVDLIFVSSVNFFLKTILIDLRLNQQKLEKIYQFVLFQSKQFEKQASISKN